MRQVKEVVFSTGESLYEEGVRRWLSSLLRRGYLAGLRR